MFLLIKNESLVHGNVGLGQVRYSVSWNKQIPSFSSATYKMADDQADILQQAIPVSAS